MAAFLMAVSGVTLVALVALVVTVWRAWVRVEEQRERLRQIANGGVPDMPPWLRRREEQLRRRR